MKIFSLAFLSGFIAIFILGCSGDVFGQYSWIKEYYSDQDVFSHKLAIDPDDNIYLVGNFSDQITLDDKSYLGGGAYLVKYDQFGNHKWHQVFKGSSQEHFGLVLAGTDDLGNVYISGFFIGSIDLGDRVLTGNGFSSYLIKYNSEGQILWANCFSGLQEIFCIAVNASGQVLINSWHSQGVLVPEEENAFGALFSPDGDLIWAKTMGTQSSNTSIPISIALDDNGNAYFTGTFDGTMQLDGHSIVSSGIHDLFVAKVDNEGTCTLLKSFRRKIDPIYENVRFAEGGSITIDESENIFIGSGFWTEIILDSFILNGDPIYNGIFVAKLNPTGDVIWATGITEHGVAENLTINKDKIYVSGVISSKPFFSELNLNESSTITPIRFPLEYTDIVVGFGIDSKDSIYMSGRRGPATSPHFRGFLFKYKPDPKISKAVLASQSYCLNNDEIILSTNLLTNASSYEWEIINDGNVIVFISQTPQIQISLSHYSINGNFTARVRGKNSNGPGEYSEIANIIGVGNPGLRLSSTCKSILVEEGTNFEWNLNGMKIQELGMEKIIYPKETGAYTISGSNACGNFSSNEINFNLLTLSEILIPNVITPNNDFLNDYFITNELLENPSLTIYNRWGKQVYQNPKYNNSWSGDGLPNGNYYYTINSECLTDRIKGWITILR